MATRGSARVSLVTGGTRGIGAAISETLAREGNTVVAVYAGNHDAAREFHEQMSREELRVTARAADIADPDACHRLVADVVAEHGRIDHVVNNAGLLVENNVLRTTRQEWDDALRVNLSGPWHLTQAALAPMVERGFGRIINVGSVSAAMGSAVEAGYCAAKAGLLGLTRSLARAMARKGITVNLVVPGIFETDMTRSMRPETQEALKAMIPVGRRGDPKELAHAVRFLAGDEAGYVTGSVVTVDGGLSMGD
jgi:NAD(P)-dependent dehydrogenase (short-subunit alcohol dehydrogenase family)